MNEVGDKLEVVDSFKQTVNPYAVPSIEMLKMFLFNSIIMGDGFQLVDGILQATPFGRINGVTYTIDEYGGLIIDIDEATRITNVLINSNYEMEVSI